MEFTVPLTGPFSLDFTLESGQVFRWERRAEWWEGVVAGSVLRVKQEGDLLRCHASSSAVDSIFVSRYFRLDDDLEQVLGTLTRDEVVSMAVQKFYGLRLVRQDRWECLASFVLATNANIPRIKKMVSSVCSKFGRGFEFGGQRYFSFPAPASLASASVPELSGCGLGYRANFLKRVASSVEEGKLDLSAVDSMDYQGARDLLLAELLGEKVLLGVGPKVADCVLLYSCGKDDSFPIDVWIARILAKSYPRLLGSDLKHRFVKDPEARLSPADYSKISKKARAYFGSFAGYAQQYLYMAARESQF